MVASQFLRGTPKKKIFICFLLVLLSSKSIYYFFSKREMEFLFLPSLWLITSTFADSQHTVTETNFRYERTELAFSS